MKLRNIFLAGLAVCTMASCSKDETIDYSQMGEVDAYVSFAAASVISTKADSEMKTNENYINSLTAYVFYDGTTDDDKKLAGVKHLTVGEAESGLVDQTTGLTGIDHIIVKVTPTSDGKSSSDQFVAVLVANAEQKTVSTLAALRNEVITNSVEDYTPTGVSKKECFLPMASGVISFKGLVPNVITADGGTTYTENWLSFSSASTKIVPEENTVSDPTTIPSGLGKVTLTRLVARVQVEAINVNIIKNYPGAKFTLKHLSLVNVHPIANIVGGTGNYVKGYQSDGYGESTKAWIYPGSEKIGTLVKEYDLALDEDEKTEAPDNITWKDSDANKFCTYIFANPEGAEYQTALLISGIFFRNEADVTGTEKHFRIFLQDTEHKGPIMVIPNYVYKLNVQITGEGSPNENEILLNAHVAATIDVAPWNVVEQNEEDAN